MHSESCCKETVWHPHGAHKVPESSVYALGTYMTPPTKIDHPMAEPLPRRPFPAIAGSLVGRRGSEATLLGYPHRPACPTASWGLPGRSAVRSDWYPTWQNAKGLRRLRRVGPVLMSQTNVTGK